jgi:hypothetical protein
VISPLTKEQNKIAEPRTAAPVQSLAGFPPGTEIQQIAFIATAKNGKTSDNRRTLCEFPPAIQRRAAIVSPGDEQPVDLLILAVPSFPAVDNSQASAEAEVLLTQLRIWVEAAALAGQPPSHLMTLQGAQVFWNQGRLAILAPVERWETIRTALIEAVFYEAELREIEQTLGTAWPQLEADAPLAFEFDDRSLKKRKVLQQRFQQVLLLRARLARIAPQVHCPHVHPPTLASQVGERFRERMRLAHRHEILDEQIEVFENIYEACGQRASDFVQTRSSNMLEWVIIVLLVTQLLLGGFEVLTSLSP